SFSVGTVRAAGFLRGQGRPVGELDAVAGQLADAVLADPAEAVVRVLADLAVVEQPGGCRVGREVLKWGPVPQRLNVSVVLAERDGHRLLDAGQVGADRLQRLEHIGALRADAVLGRDAVGGDVAEVKRAGWEDRFAAGRIEPDVVGDLGGWWEQEEQLGSPLADIGVCDVELALHVGHDDSFRFTQARWAEVVIGGLVGSSASRSLSPVGLRRWGAVQPRRRTFLGRRRRTSARCRWRLGAAWRSRRRRPRPTLRGGSRPGN